MLVQAFTERPDVTLSLSATFESLDLASQRHRTTMLASLSTFFTRGFLAYVHRIADFPSVLALYAAFRAFRTTLLVTRLSFPVSLPPSLPDKLAKRSVCDH